MGQEHVLWEEGGEDVGEGGGGEVTNPKQVQESHIHLRLFQKMEEDPDLTLSYLKKIGGCEVSPC
jgi:hypothetical protein